MCGGSEFEIHGEVILPGEPMVGDRAHLRVYAVYIGVRILGEGQQPVEFDASEFPERCTGVLLRYGSAEFLHAAARVHQSDDVPEGGLHGKCRYISAYRFGDDGPDTSGNAFYYYAFRKSGTAGFELLYEAGEISFERIVKGYAPFRIPDLQVHLLYRVDDALVQFISVHVFPTVMVGI